MGTRCGVSNPNSAAVPATVSGKRSATKPLTEDWLGRRRKRDRAVSQETCRGTSLVRPAGSSRRTGCLRCSDAGALVRIAPRCRCMARP